MPIILDLFAKGVTRQTARVLRVTSGPGVAGELVVVEDTNGLHSEFLAKSGTYERGDHVVLTWVKKEK